MRHFFEAQKLCFGAFFNYKFSSEMASSNFLGVEITTENSKRKKNDEKLNSHASNK